MPRHRAVSMPVTMAAALAGPPLRDCAPTPERFTQCLGGKLTDSGLLSRHEGAGRAAAANDLALMFITGLRPFASSYIGRLR